MYTEASSTIAEGTGRGMWSFQYKHGDRPLDGYTIQRAAGRGGFGEVYYAISDAGREVALKVITGFEQIELRGISQCMNLKSPHLVTIFDVKQNAEGRSFVIMEFVSGLNLRELLDQSPSGLGTQKAAFFLREIAKGLSYLHDCGIVHRDLKPANIFYENGYVKIGDYGLSKAIAPTHHSGQTVTVGTVHYMAPEVGCGKYDRSIDIYALGALLYEMLTGVVPFVGASAGEILIKHLSHDADCSGIPEPFCSAIRKAMAKDPANRFATVQEMVEAVFGAEHVRNSVSQFAPQELSMIAERVAQRITSPVRGPVTPPPIIGNTSSSVTAPNGLGTPGGAYAAGYVAGTTMLAGKRISNSILGPFADTAPGVDPFTLQSRLGLAAIATIVVATCAMAFSDANDHGGTWAFVVAAIIGGSFGVAFVGRKWMPWRKAEHYWMDRFALGGAGAICAILLAGVVWVDSNEHQRWVGGMFISILAALTLANPRRWVQTDRKQRVSFGPAAAAGAVAFGFAVMFDRDCNPAAAIGIAGGIALVVQMLTPWDARAAALRDDDDEDDDDDDDDEDDENASSGEAKTRYTQPAPMPAGAAMNAAAHANGPAVPEWPFPPIAVAAPRLATWPGRKVVPRGVLITWFIVSALAFCIGVGCFVPTVVNGSRDSDFPTTLSLSVVFFIVSLWAFIRLCHKTYQSVGHYFVLPLIRLGLFLPVVVAFIHLTFGRNRPGDRDDFMTIMAIFTMLWLIMWIIPLIWKLVIPPTVAAVAAAPATSSSTAPAGESNGGAVPTPPVAPAPAVTESSTAARPVGSQIPTLPALPALSAFRKRRRESDILGSFANLVAVAFLITALIAIVGVAIDVPQMVAAGVPDPSLSNQLSRDVFGSSVPDWPQLVRNMVTPIGVILFLVGGACLIIARRRTTGWHIARGIIGVFGLALSCGPIQSDFAFRKPWQQLSHLPMADRSGWAAVQVFLDALGGGAVASVIVLAGSFLVLMWPNRRPAAPREEVAI